MGADILMQLREGCSACWNRIIGDPASVKRSHLIVIGRIRRQPSIRVVGGIGREINEDVKVDSVGRASNPETSLVT